MDKESRIIPTAQSVFGLGTFSCVFTTSLLSVLDEQGIVSLTDPVQDYFPSNVHIAAYLKYVCRPPSEPLYYPTLLNCFPDPLYHPSEITLCDLSTHTSGLPYLPFNLRENKKDDYSGFSLNDLYRFLNNSRPNSPSGAYYVFSPLGIALIANGLEWKLNADFEPILITSLLQPLQLNSTFIYGTEEQRMLQVPGYDKKNRRIEESEYGILAGSFGLHSSAEDLSSFVLANLSAQLPSESSQDDVMNSALRNTQQPKVAILYNKEFSDSYARMGWIISPLKANTAPKVIWQSSSMNGYACYIGFVNETKTGVVVLSNSDQPVDKIGKNLLMLLNLQAKSAKNDTNQ